MLLICTFVLKIDNKIAIYCKLNDKILPLHQAPANIAEKCLVNGDFK